MAAAPQNKVYFYLFLAFVLILAGVILWPMKDLILFSWIIVTVFMPIYKFYAVRLKLKKYLATIFSILSVGVLVFIPVAIIFNLTVAQFGVLYRDLQEFTSGNTQMYEAVSGLFERINELLARIPYVTYQISIDSITSLLQENLSPIANTILNVSIDVGVGFFTKFPLVIVLMYLVWFGFPEYDRIIGTLKRISPLPEVMDNMYLDRITTMIKGIVKGTFSIAMVQGTVAWLSILISGVPYAFLWTLLVILFSIIPLGSGLVTFPLGVGLILLGNVWQGVFILAVQLLITSNIDNVLRPILIPKEAEIHPALLLLSFLGGIQVFGFAGLIYGPIIMVILVTTFEIYQKYFKVKV